ncbi:MAG: PDZ domain-containing protein, partial [Candidatus Latescibacteria bacterium]|nr:PDZ domain-containing protein [Candidatus Latescibacterota bacterium]
MNRSRCVLLRLGCILAVASGCGFGGESGKNCRCVPETDAASFPHCEGITFEEEVETANPFATRQPECPSGQLLFLREPTTPEAVLFNVRDTFQGFSPIQYLDLLSDDFLFVPDLDGLSLYPEVFQAPGDYDPEADRDTLWTREDERRFATNFLDRTEFQRITFDRWYQAGEDDVIFDDSDPLRETYIFNYAIELILPPGEDGVAVLSVIDGGGAQQAGIQENDVIIGINDVNIASAIDLQKNPVEPGDTVNVTIVRDGSEIVIPVT